MDDTKLILVGIIAIVAVVAIRLLANMDNIIGRIFRWWWNISMKMGSFVPILGILFSRLIIGDAAIKIKYEKIADEVSDAAGTYLENKAAKERREQEELERIRVETARQLGGNFISVNADGTEVTYEDKKGRKRTAKVNYID